MFAGREVGSGELVPKPLRGLVLDIGAYQRSLKFPWVKDVLSGFGACQ